MATQFEYFGFLYEIIEGKNNEVGLVKATNANGRVVIPKIVEYQGKSYTVTALRGRNVQMKEYRGGVKETDRRKRDYWRVKPTLTNIRVEHRGPFTSDPEEYLDYAGQKQISNYPSNKSITSIILPNTINEICEFAFVCLSNLEEITIPIGITKIPKAAFKYCYELQTIVIPDGVTSIGDCAFECCYKLQTIVIPEGVTSIGDCAFECCDLLKELTIPSTVRSIGDRAFRNYCINETRNYNYNILNDEGEIVIHPNAFNEGVNINYLGKPKVSEPVSATEKVAKEEKKDTTPAKGATIDLEKLIQAALVDGVVTDKERAILLKKVKEAGGDTDEFELLLDARIYEAQQKNAPKKEAPKKEKETPTAEKKVVEKIEEPKKEKETPKEVKQTAKSASSTAPCRDVWENMEKDVKPALQILDKLVAGMPYVQDGTYQVNYDSKSYIGFSQNGKAKNFATFAPQPKALVVNAWGMADSEEIENVGKALPNFEHKVTSRNVSYHTFKIPVDKAPTAEQTKAALTILEMARKNYEK